MSKSRTFESIVRNPPPNVEFRMPFNLPPREFADMYHGKLPELLHAVVITVHPRYPEDIYGEPQPLKVPAWSKQLCDFLGTEKELDPGTCGLPCKIEFTVVHDMCPFAESFASPPDSEWMDDRPYLQLGFISQFWDPSEIPVNALVAAMTLYDSHWRNEESLVPGDYPFSICVMSSSRGFELVVGDVFKKGWGYMNFELIEWRNKALIMARAFVNGRNPNAEYKKFIKAGGKYFLEYPRLCP